MAQKADGKGTGAPTGAAEGEGQQPPATAREGSAGGVVEHLERGMRDAVEARDARVEQMLNEVFDAVVASGDGTPKTKIELAEVLSRAKKLLGRK